MQSVILKILLTEKLHSQVVAFIRNNELFNCKEDLDIIIESFINNGLIHKKVVMTVLDVSLWNQYKYIVISYKMLIIAGISNETTNELTICAILYQNVTIFYQEELASLFQVQEKLKACRNAK